MIQVSTGGFKPLGVKEKAAAITDDFPSSSGEGFMRFQLYAGGCIMPGKLIYDFLLSLFGD